MKKSLTGKLHIGRITSNSGDDYIRIELDDEKSGTIVTRIEIGLAEFAKALTSSCVNCKFDFSGTRVGLTREVKTEVIYIPAKSYMKKN